MTATEKFYEAKPLINKTVHEFIDISSEKWRKYLFYIKEDNKEVFIKIEDPEWLSVDRRGAHRIKAQHECFYIPPKWYALVWEPKEGGAHFVK